MSGVGTSGGVGGPGVGELVVGYDGTTGAHAALREAISLARAMGTGLVVAFGYEPTQLAGDTGPLREAVRERGRTAMAEASAEARTAGVPVEEALVGDRPAEALAALAVERGARMIVVGGYGERPITGALLGSIPHRLLHLTDVPVLVVRAEPD